MFVQVEVGEGLVPFSGPEMLQKKVNGARRCSAEAEINGTLKLKFRDAPMFQKQVRCRIREGD